MKTIKLLGVIFLSACTVFSVAQLVSKPPVQTADPLINFKIPLSKTSQIVYAIRYSQLLDAKTANELADFLVNQANDTTLNKSLAPTSPVGKQK